MKVLQKLMFWAQTDGGRNLAAVAQWRPKRGTTQLREIVLNPDALDSKGTPETLSERAEKQRHGHEKRGEEPPNY